MQHLPRGPSVFVTRRSSHVPRGLSAFVTRRSSHVPRSMGLFAMIWNKKKLHGTYALLFQPESSRTASED